MLLQPLGHGEEGCEGETAREHGPKNRDNLGNAASKELLRHTDAQVGGDLLDYWVDDPLGESLLRQLLQHLLGHRAIHDR